MEYTLDTGRILEIIPKKNCRECNGSGYKPLYRNRWDREDFKDSLKHLYEQTGNYGEYLKKYEIMEKIYAEVRMVCDCVRNQVEKQKQFSESFII